jgi:hypothetical protein
MRVDKKDEIVWKYCVTLIGATAKYEFTPMGVSEIWQQGISVR